MHWNKIKGNCLRGLNIKKQQHYTAKRGINIDRLMGNKNPASTQ